MPLIFSPFFNSFDFYANSLSGDGLRSGKNPYWDNNNASKAPPPAPTHPSIASPIISMVAFSAQHTTYLVPHLGNLATCLDDIVWVKRIQPWGWFVLHNVDEPIVGIHNICSMLIVSCNCSSLIQCNKRDIFPNKCQLPYMKSWRMMGILKETWAGMDDMIFLKTFQGTGKSIMFDIFFSIMYGIWSKHSSLLLSTKCTFLPLWTFIPTKFSTQLLN